ncbi:MAG: hypothetical protein FH758_08090 [Firmicutes bacterium]|nr:hypothetical protein [Bacillota bacterium]
MELKSVVEELFCCFGGGPMNEQELREAIDQTKEKIYQIKSQIEFTDDSQERLRLKRKLKELQYKQLWHLDQLG